MTETYFLCKHCHYLHFPRLLPSPNFSYQPYFLFLVLLHHPKDSASRVSSYWCNNVNYKNISERYISYGYLVTESHRVPDLNHNLFTSFWLNCKWLPIYVLNSHQCTKESWTQLINITAGFTNATDSWAERQAARGKPKTPQKLKIRGHLAAVRTGPVCLGPEWSLHTRTWLAWLWTEAIENACKHNHQFTHSFVHLFTKWTHGTHLSVDILALL